MKPVTHFVAEVMMTILALITLVIGTAVIALSYINILNW